MYRASDLPMLEKFCLTKGCRGLLDITCCALDTSTNGAHQIWCFVPSPGFPNVEVLSCPLLVRAHTLGVSFGVVISPRFTGFDPSRVFLALVLRGAGTSIREDR